MSAPLLAQGQAASDAKQSDPLLDGFVTPGEAARPRVWWHWMNGNITADGVRKDMEWMKRVGIAGLQAFDAGNATPQVVEKRLPYMTDGWKAAFREAAVQADRLGLELGIAASPGWSETGGPWVTAPDAMKKLAWSEMRITGGVSVISCVVGRFNNYAAMALMKRSPNITANWAFAMDHSRGGIVHSFSVRFKIR